MTDRIGAVDVKKKKKRDMTDCISVVYAGRQNKKNAMDRMGVVNAKKKKNET